MAFQRKLVLKRVIYGFGDQEEFLGGQSDWQELFVDEETGEVVKGNVIDGEPIEGVLQPGTPLSLILNETEQQRLSSLEKIRSERDELKIKVRDMGVENVELKQDKKLLQEDLDNERKTKRNKKE